MPIDTQDITGLILAGGAGSRAAGADKGLIPWHGQPLVEHVISRLAPQVGPIVISCNRNIERYLDYAPTVQDRRDDYQGPLAGLEAAATHIATPYILVAPCDAPELPTDLVPRLAQTLARLELTPGIAYANDGERDQYLCALLHRQCLLQLGHFLESGERAVRRWYSTQNTAVTDFSDQPQAFTNLNHLSSR